jgi:hypothetical protein
MHLAFYQAEYRPKRAQYVSQPSVNTQQFEMSQPIYEYDLQKSVYLYHYCLAGCDVV